MSRPLMGLGTAITDNLDSDEGVMRRAGNMSRPLMGDDNADTYLDNQLWNAGPTWLPHSEEWPTWKYDQSILQTTSKSEDTSLQQTTNVVTLNCTEIHQHREVQYLPEITLRHRLCTQIHPQLQKTKR